MKKQKNSSGSGNGGTSERAGKKIGLLDRKAEKWGLL